MLGIGFPDTMQGRNTSTSATALTNPSFSSISGAASQKDKLLRQNARRYIHTRRDNTHSEYLA